MRLCGSTAAAVAGAGLAGELQATQPVKLRWGDGKPVTWQTMEVETEYLFFYPYRSTPCFLLRLNTPAEPIHLATADGRRYRWQGGVGPNRSLVAFSAICAHRLTHPSKSVSFIGYRREPVGYLNKEHEVVQRAGIIQCCSEHSIYDPGAGARVISGPAAQPLAAVDMRLAAGELEVSGIYGGQLFDNFFEEFGFRLGLEFGERDYRQPIGDHAVVMRTEDYTRQRVQC